MEEEIKEKLQTFLRKEVLEETDIVFILTKIRKILEIKNLKSKFKVLNFYCNWALHSEIHDTNAISTRLTEQAHGVFSLLHFFEDFDKDFKNFLSESDMTAYIFQDVESLLKFHHKLSEIYSNTPLIVIINGITRKIVFKKQLEFGKNSAMFSVDSSTINKLS